MRYKIKTHQNIALTCQLAALERDCRISQIVKTMVGKDDRGNYHVCLVPGDKTLKIKKVRKEAGGIKIDLVHPENIAKELELIVGAISPLVFPQNTKFYIDPTVLNEKYVTISSGDPLAGIELLSEDLAAIMEAKVCDIISPNS